MNHRVDVAIIGSGFAGSILAWILARQGFAVALIDSATHPRLAIGESSTPIADMLLRRLGQDHDLAQLDSLSSWGSWQQSHPELACGRKRGFSYYVHRPGRMFSEDRGGQRSLLVAASASDEVSDTHWYRSDIDHFLHSQAVKAGATDLTGHTVTALETCRSGRQSLHCAGSSDTTVQADWVVDASGQAGVTARLRGVEDRAGQLRTRTHSTFGHYRNVGSWTTYLQQHGVDTNADPFDGDDAAQHHLLDGGWLWMLRFNNAVTSIGYTAPDSSQLDWSNFPSLDSLMQNAELVAPRGGPRRTGRLQRLFDPVAGPRCIMLPTAAATIDPLHSTGIAHGLAGVHRLATILSESSSQVQTGLIQQYRQSVLEETLLLDRLVSTAYRTMNDFPRFTAACMLYFAGAIRCEERYLQGETPTHLWNADEREFVDFVDWACRLLPDRSEAAFEELIRERLEPWNTAGLMNSAVGNRYAYTATKQ